MTVDTADRDVETVDIWNKIALTRYEQLRSNSDKVYSDILLPALLSLLRKCDLSRVLDVGCGTGHGTRVISSHADHVAAIDSSPGMTEIARNVCSDVSNVVVAEEDILAPSQWLMSQEFTTITCLMSLNGIRDLNRSMECFRHLASRRASFVSVVPHPVLWPLHRGYFERPNFSYDEEKPVLDEFRIRGESSGPPSVYFHRPMTAYLNCLILHGFTLREMREFGDEDGPRFLGLRASLQE